jgi:hypothetical protein
LAEEFVIAKLIVFSIVVEYEFFDSYLPVLLEACAVVSQAR